MSNKQFDARTWKNLQSDVHLGLHANAMRLLLASMVAPSLDAIDSRIDELEHAQANPFEIDDLVQLRGAAIEAFVLAIQSQFERQIRAFLIGCAKDLKRDESFVHSLHSCPWHRLDTRFQELRGLSLKVFDSYTDLNELHVLANACRHGDGDSSRKLYELRPELWVCWPPSLPQSWPSRLDSQTIGFPPFAQITIPREYLMHLGRSVVWFWEDHNYLYCNSIQIKHPSTVRELEIMRGERAMRKRFIFDRKNL
jgi:hypothetical protein